MPIDNTITVFGETNYRNQRRKFGIKIDDRRRHMYMVGKTGMGKSTLIENMVINDIKQGHGVAIVDPHGDLVEKIIKFIPAERINDVVYFNPADTNYPIAFNILESIDPEYKHLIAYGLVGVFKKIWADSWGPRMEYILTNTILALLEYPGTTLLGIMRMLVDKKYRKKVVTKVTDPVVKTFWTDEYANYSEKFRTEAIAPIQNKVGQFLASSIIRNIVGQSKSTIEMRSIIDSGKIVLMNLSKGRIGEENSALLGAMMITKLQLAAMSRVDIPEDERKDFFLYVDEFQNFATESFANILSEARKYRLDIIMAHQYIDQLDEEVKFSVFGNVGTMIMFRLGATDAAAFEHEVEPRYLPIDLVNIPKWHFIIKLMIDGVASSPFSAIGLPPHKLTEDYSEKVIRVSREHYARPKKQVEDRILRWSGFDVETTEDKNEPKKEEEQKATPIQVQKTEEQKPQEQIEVQPKFKAPSFIKYDFNEEIEKEKQESVVTQKQEPIKVDEPIMKGGLELDDDLEEDDKEEEDLLVKTPTVQEEKKVTQNQFNNQQNNQPRSNQPINNQTNNQNFSQSGSGKRKRKRHKKHNGDQPFSAQPFNLNNQNIVKNNPPPEISLSSLTNKTVPFIKAKNNNQPSSQNKADDKTKVSIESFFNN